jgi:hypothetical protein
MDAAEIRQVIERVVAELRAGGVDVEVDDAAREVTMTIDDLERSPLLEPVRAFLRAHPQSARMARELLAASAISELLIREVRALRSPRPR